LDKSSPGSLNTARRNLAGAGTQTAALAFGGIDTAATGATEEYDGTSWATNPTGLNTARTGLAGAGIQTAALAFGGTIQLLQEQQKNIMELLGQKSNRFKYSKRYFRRLWHTNSSTCFWWYVPPETGATEEYDGTTWTSVKFKYSKICFSRLWYTNSST
jgi:hypothetical protein